MYHGQLPRPSAAPRPAAASDHAGTGGLGGVAHWAATGCTARLTSGAAWRFALTAATMMRASPSRSWRVVLVLSGMLFFALLVGLIGESIEAKIASLKQGKGAVLESATRSCGLV